MYYLFSKIIELLSIPTAHAATDIENAKNVLSNTADHVGTELPKATDLPVLIGTLVNYGFGILGTIFLVIMLIGGFEWMMAGGNEDKVSSAKGMIGGAINGMIIIFLAYALVYVVLAALRAGTGGA